MPSTNLAVDIFLTNVQTLPSLTRLTLDCHLVASVVSLPL